MKKNFIILLAVLLLCGVFACGKTELPQQIETVSATDAQNQPSTVAPGSVQIEAGEQPAAANEAVFSAENARALSLKTDRNTVWTYQYGYDIVVNENGTAYLLTPNEVFVLIENGDTFLSETQLYRAKYDTEPVMTLPAGELRLLTDGETLKIEVLSDPLGILTLDLLNGRVLEKTEYHVNADFNFFSAPLEPGTKWFQYFDMGEHQYACLNMTIAEDGAMNGTLRFPDGTQKNCALLGNREGFAIVDESGETPELLFYGIRRKPDEAYFETTRYETVRVALDPICDPLELCGIDAFELWREFGRDTELPYIIGGDLDAVILALIRDGWTDRTLEVETLNPLFEGFFAWLVKDGRTLFIHTDYDYSQPYELSNAFPDAFVLYDTDGTVLEWSGSRPLDHAIADGYKRPKGVYFYSMDGVTGAMITGEDQDAYFLDDGRIAIEFLPHEDGDGDVDFQIVKVIP